MDNEKFSFAKIKFKFRNKLDIVPISALYFRSKSFVFENFIIEKYNNSSQTYLFKSSDKDGDDEYFKVFVLILGKSIEEIQASKRIPIPSARVVGTSSDSAQHIEPWMFDEDADLELSSQGEDEAEDISEAYLVPGTSKGRKRKLRKNQKKDGPMQKNRRGKPPGAISAVKEIVSKLQAQRRGIVDELEENQVEQNEEDNGNVAVQVNGGAHDAGILAGAGAQDVELPDAAAILVGDVPGDNALNEHPAAAVGVGLQDAGGVPGAGAQDVELPDAAAILVGDVPGHNAQNEHPAAAVGVGLQDAGGVPGAGAQDVELPDGAPILEDDVLGDGGQNVHPAAGVGVGVQDAGGVPGNGAQEGGAVPMNGNQVGRYVIRRGQYPRPKRNRTNFVIAASELAESPGRIRYQLNDQGNIYLGAGTSVSPMVWGILNGIAEPSAYFNKLLQVHYGNNLPHRCLSLDSSIVNDPLLREFTPHKLDVIFRNYFDFHGTRNLILEAGTNMKKGFNQISKGIVNARRSLEF